MEDRRTIALHSTPRRHSVCRSEVTGAARVSAVVSRMSATSTNAASPPSFRPRRFEALVFLAWGLVTNYAAYLVAHYAFLIHRYGFARVRGEHLHFTAIPKGSAWIVSNGDRITEGHFLHFAIHVVLWLAFFAVTYPLVRRWLPGRKDGHEG